MSLNSPSFIKEKLSNPSIILDTQIANKQDNLHHSDHTNQVYPSHYTKSMSTIHIIYTIGQD